MAEFFVALAIIGMVGAVAFVLVVGIEIVYQLITGRL